MGKVIDLTGSVFTRLTVTKFLGRTGSRVAWECLCTCGNVRSVYGCNLKKGRTKSCGCLNTEMSKARVANADRHSVEYVTWSNMMARCYDKSNRHYKNYGGRGIAVSARWHKFANFYSDMGRKPLGLTLERKDNDEGYSFENCTWASLSSQSRNRRNNVWYEIDGMRKTQTDWAISIGVKPAVIRHRLRLGWTLKAACTTPSTRLRATK